MHYSKYIQLPKLGKTERNKLVALGYIDKPDKYEGLLQQAQILYNTIKSVVCLSSHMLYLVLVVREKLSTSNTYLLNSKNKHKRDQKVECCVVRINRCHIHEVFDGAKYYKAK